MALAALLLVPPFARAQDQEFRALWVDAWGEGFLNASQVSSLISACRTYNFNAVVVQMRRRGDAFYMPGISGNDPRTTAVASNFDALEEIIRQARNGSPRIEVHCWVTTQLIWSHPTLNPPQASHVFNRHPEFLMKDFNGGMFLSEGYYLDPGHPEAAYWNYRMATNIVSRYDLDGFHWDYIRYPNASSGYNDVAIARFNEEFGRTGLPSPGDPQFSEWRRRQVTDFLRWTNADLLAIRPSLQISAAVFASRTDAFSARYQDWAAWNQEGIIDLCMPMNYTANNATYNARVDDAVNREGVRRIYMGPGAYLNTKENTLSQLLYSRNRGLRGSVLYSYRTPNSGTVNRAETFTHIRDHYQPTYAAPPPLPWKANPTHGIIRGRVIDEATGQPIYNANVVLATSPVRTQRTNPQGRFAFFETVPGSRTVGASAAGNSANATVSVSAGGNVFVTLEISTVDTTPPDISNVRVESIADRAALIAWDTNEPADSAVDYGTTISYGSTVGSASLVTEHSMLLSNLTPSTTYEFRVRSKDAAGNEAVSVTYSFATAPEGQVEELLIDNPEAAVVGSWSTGTFAGGYGSDYRWKGKGNGSAYLEYRPLILQGGTYEVYEWHLQGGNRTTSAPHFIRHKNGASTVHVNQQANGGRWNLLGTYEFEAGTDGYVRITDAFLDDASVVIADAIRFVHVPAPVIARQPQDQTVNVGESATFSVEASGAAPLTFQWHLNGGDISGATSSSYTIHNVQASHAGEYAVTVSNTGGSAVSSAAVLAVNVPPVPLQIESLEVLEHGSVHLVISGEPGRYVVKVSSDLIDWEVLASIELENGVAEYIDDSSPGGRRFYTVREE
jgi:uncharacterized lipoprotein YddW (UPF0748 family)